MESGRAQGCFFLEEWRSRIPEALSANPARLKAVAFCAKLQLGILEDLRSNSHVLKVVFVFPEKWQSGVLEVIR